MGPEEISAWQPSGPGVAATSRTTPQGMPIYYLRLNPRDFTMWELIEETSR